MPNGIELRYCGTSRHRFDWWWSEIEGRWLEETEVAELFRELEARVAELEAENQILKNAESDLRAFAMLCRESAKKILGMP